MRVLDVGCGLNKYKGKEGDVVIGIDLFNPEYADVQHDLNIFPYPFKDNEFDMIWCNSVFEHIDNSYDPIEHKNNQVKAVEEFWRITKPGGKVCINVPHWSSFVTWGHMDHRRGYGFGSFNMFGVDSYGEKINSKARFKVKSRIRWIVYFTHANNRLLGSIARMLNSPVEKVINISYLTKMLAERFLCYYLGGFDEVSVIMEVVK